MKHKELKSTSAPKNPNGQSSIQVIHQFLLDELVGKSRSMEIYGSSDTKSLRFQEHFQVKTPKQFDIHQPNLPQPQKNGSKKQVTHCKLPPKRQPKNTHPDGHGKKTSAESRKNRCQNMESLMSLKRSLPWSLGSMGRKQWEGRSSSSSSSW